MSSCLTSQKIDYLHRTGRTARMGAKGKVTSLVAKKDVGLATRIEDAMKKNESLESLTTSNVRRDSANSQNPSTKGRTYARSARSSDAPRGRSARSSDAPRVASQKGNKRGVTLSRRSPKVAVKDTTSTRKRSSTKSQPSSSRKHSPSKNPPKARPAEARKAKPVRAGSSKGGEKAGKSSRARPEGGKGDALNKVGSKLSVVGFRGRSTGKSAQAS
ncbi:unnamed protein product [Triticum turgidum subsp. durum]|uniref:Helicase C-terminal domain-containing protein n=1 Tax=Triticum turgidum subsp. durum TaxID=4567 RepID=A0A9R0RDG3_TRITD|nr:unnamed protein product [Triticum turgidum subsp. durum]